MGNILNKPKMLVDIFALFLSIHCIKQHYPELTVTKGPTTIMSRLAARASQFKKSVKKAEGHLRRLGNECDRER